MDITRQGQFLGTNTTAGSGSSLQHQHRPSGLGHADGRRESIRTGANYDGVGPGQIEPRDWDWHSLQDKWFNASIVENVLWAAARGFITSNCIA
jgi:hypothetical protein